MPETAAVTGPVALTGIPAIDGWDLEIAYHPLELVPGDYWMAFQNESGVWLGIADVAGKGVTAAMVVAMLHEIRRTRPDLFLSATPRAVALELNDLLKPALPESLFVTMVLGRLNPQTGSFLFVNCGHPPPFWVRASGKQVEMVKGAGPAIGLVGRRVAQHALREETIDLQKGDQLFFCTDGLLEAMDRERNEYGEERTSRSLARAASGPPSSFLHSVLKDLRTFLDGAPMRDDLTMMWLRRRRLEEATLRVRAAQSSTEFRVTVEQAARSLNTSPERVRQLILRGNLPAIFDPDAWDFFPSGTAVSDYLQLHRTAPPGQLPVAVIVTENQDLSDLLLLELRRQGCVRPVSIPRMTEVAAYKPSLVIVDAVGPTPWKEFVEHLRVSRRNWGDVATFVIGVEPQETGGETRVWDAAPAKPEAPASPDARVSQTRIAGGEPRTTQTRALAAEARATQSRPVAEKAGSEAKSGITRTGAVVSALGGPTATRMAATRGGGADMGIRVFPGRSNLGQILRAVEELFPGYGG